MTTVVVAGVIGFLGDVVFELQRNRRSAEIARDNLETMLEITQYTAMITSGVNDLMRRMARAIGERHRYQVVGIYILESGGDDVRLAGWLGSSRPSSVTREGGTISSVRRSPPWMPGWFRMGVHGMPRSPYGTLIRQWEFCSSGLRVPTQTSEE